MFVLNRTRNCSVLRSSTLWFHTTRFSQPWIQIFLKNPESPKKQNLNLLLAKLLLWIHVKEVVCRCCLGAVYGWGDEFRCWEGAHKVQADSRTSSEGFTRLESWLPQGLLELTFCRSQGSRTHCVLTQTRTVFSHRHTLHIGSDRVRNSWTQRCFLTRSPTRVLDPAPFI